MSVIYKIRSDQYPERIYIGSAKNFINRMKLHISQLEKNKHHNPKLQNHHNKYGSKDLSFEILEKVQCNNLLEREQYYIDSLKPYFNICLIAGSREDQKNSDIHNQKISKAMKISMLGNKNGLGNSGCRGRKLSEAHKQKIKDNHWRKKKTNELKLLLEINKG